MLFRVPNKNVTTKKAAPAIPREPGFLRARVNDYHVRRKVELWQGRHPLQGRTPQPGDIKVRSNDYLCLAGHPTSSRARSPRCAAAATAMRSRASGCITSVTLSAYSSSASPRSCSPRIASLCSSGYTANVGLIQSFATRGSPVYLDMKAHISLHEGVVSAGATPRPVPPQRSAVARSHAGPAWPGARRGRRPLQHRRQHGAAGRAGRSLRAPRRGADRRRNPLVRHARPERRRPRRRRRPRGAGALPYGRAVQGGRQPRRPDRLARAAMPSTSATNRCPASSARR